MITRRTLEGALKCALRDFRREEETAVCRNSRQYFCLSGELPAFIATAI